jgi:hypothetical protein
VRESPSALSADLPGPRAGAIGAGGLPGPRVVGMIADMENLEADYLLSAEQCRRRAPRSAPGAGRMK